MIALMLAASLRAPIAHPHPLTTAPPRIARAARNAADLSAKRRAVPRVRWHLAIASVYDEPQSLAGPYPRYRGVGDPRLMVAHKTLPFGTRVRLRYGGRECVATVTDRGPYVGGREFDLTWATRKALGIGNTVVRLEWRREG